MQYTTANLNGGWEVTVARSLKEVEAIRTIWEEMQSKECYPIINSDIDRYISVVEGNDRETEWYVMLARKNSRPIAMTIARIQQVPIELKLGYKTFLSPTLKCLGVTYGGIIGQLTKNVCEMFVKELMKALSRGEADIIRFNHLRTDSQMYRAAKAIPGFLCRNHFSKMEPHWQTFIPNHADKVQKMVSKKHQRDIARCVRKLEKACSGPVDIVSYHENDDLEEFIHIASRIANSTYKGALGVGFSNNALTRSLIWQSEKNKWLRAYVLYAGTEPVAFELGSVYSNVYFAQQASFDPRWRSYGPGTILQLRIFKELSREREVNIYDYGTGDAVYKRRFGDNYWQEASVYIFAPRVYPVAVNMLQSAIAGLSLGLNRLSDKAGITIWLKRRWRDHLQSKSKQEEK